MTTARYSEFDAARFVTEAPKNPDRSAFARDRARVLHCGALRRLAGKTQVFVAGESDVPRTRLTHSLEVAQVARELGRSLGCDPDVVDVAGLAHDLGHPPFGHNGEAELDRLGAAAGGFEGNAQTFRVLTRLEAKIDGAGLNLTRASLDATAKYPWLRQGDERKYGCYDDDEEIFTWVRQDAPSGRPSLEAQVMDWADDVAYSVHDIDDAIQLGWLDPTVLASPHERARVVDRCLAWYLPGADPAALDEALARLQGLDFWVDGYDGTMRSLAATKRMTSELIGRFSLAAQRATRQRYGPAPLHRFAADLVIPDSVRHEVAMMKAVAATYVMLRPGAEGQYEQQRRMIAEVFAALIRSDGRFLAAWLTPDWAAAGDDAQRQRVVMDQIASLTDASLKAWHGRLVAGQGVATAR